MAAGCRDVCTADVFVERAFVRKGEAGSGYGAPESGCGVNHGGGLVVGNLAIERALVYIVVKLASCPVDGLAGDCWIEVADSCDVLWSAGYRGNRPQKESESQEAGCFAVWESEE